MEAVKEWVPTPEEYEADARAYARSLTLEDKMEAQPAGIQREITLASLSALSALRGGGFAFFNELLLQKPRKTKIAKIVPDNFIVLGEPQGVKRTAWRMDLETCPVLLAIEYVSQKDAEKDYDSGFDKYEDIFQPPYLVQFSPSEQSLLVHRFGAGRYDVLDRNAEGRFAVPELDLELGLLGGWMRFWYKGELIGLTEDWMDRLDRANADLKALKASNDRLAAKLRPRVEKLARASGRTDILAALEKVDAEQLGNWLDELL